MAEEHVITPLEKRVLHKKFDEARQSLIDAKFVEPTTDMCIFAMFCGIDGVFNLAEAAFRYSCIEAEQIGLDKEGEVFYLLNIRNRDLHLRIAIKDLDRMRSEKPEERFKFVSYSDDKLREIIRKQYSRYVGVDNQQPWLVA